MSKKMFLILSTLFIFSIVALADLTFSPQVYQGQNFKVTLQHDERIVSGNLFFREVGNPSFRKIRLNIFTSEAEAYIPSSLLSGENYEFYIEYMDIKNDTFRLPASNTNFFSVIADDVAPEIRVLRPSSKESFTVNQEVKVVIYIEELQSTVKKENIDFTINGEPVDFIYDVGVLQYSKAYSETGLYDISINVEDDFGNTNSQTISYRVQKEREPIFDFGFTPDYSLKAGMTYDKQTENDGFKMENFTGGETNFNFSQNISLDTYAKIWFIKTGFNTNMTQRSDSITNLFEDFTGQLGNDLEDFGRLFTPLFTFNPEGFFTGINDYDDYDRKVSQTNFHKFYFDAGIFDYTFGDEDVNFSDYTVKNTNVRGHHLGLDLFLLNADLVAGNTQMGQFGTSYPQFYFGTNLGVKLPWDIFTLDTELSYVTDFQGEYPDWDLKEEWSIPDSVKPQENLLIGLRTGSNLGLFKTSLFTNLDLYLSDVSDPVDLPTLLSNPTLGATELAATIEETIPEYLFDYITVSEKSIPLMDIAQSGVLGFLSGDEFDLADLDAAAISNIGLWGLIIGADFEIPWLNIEASYHKADKAYKSMLASSPSDEVFWGVEGDWDIFGIDLKAEYSHTHESIPDILFSDIIPIVEGGDFDFVKSFISPEVNENTEISDEYAASIGLDIGKVLGKLKAGYSLTDTQENFTSETEFDEKTEHEIKGSWKGFKVGFGEFEVSLDFDGFGNYVVPKADSYLEFGYSNKTTVDWKEISLHTKFSDEHEGIPEVDRVLGREMGIGLKNPLFGSSLKTTYTYNTKMDIENIEFFGDKTYTEHNFKTSYSQKLWWFDLDVGAEYTTKDTNPTGTDGKSTDFEINAEIEFSF